MAASHRGYGLTLGFGVESTYGTAVARTNWLPMESTSLRRDRQREVIPHQGYLGQVSTNPRDHFVVADMVEGTFAWPCAYDDSTVLLLRHLLGANVTAGAGPFTHTLTLASPFANSLTIEQISGTPATGNMTEVFEGCVLASGRLSCESGGPLKGEITVIGETSQGPVAAGTPTYNTTRSFVKHNHAGTLTVQGTAMPFKSIGINIDRQLDRNQEMGSLFTTTPIEKRLAIELEIQAFWQASQWLTNQYADTVGNVTLTFTDSPRSLALTAHNCVIMDRSAPVSGPGGITETLRLKAFADSSNQGLTAVFTNANAAHSTN